jgi:hypothetical protein
MTITEKLHPQRFPNMSPRMGAIVGCVLGEEFTTPVLEELCITVDGCVLGRERGDCGHNMFIGSAVDLARNWSELLDAAGLSAEETAEAWRMYRGAVEDFREVS